MSTVCFVLLLVALPMWKHVVLQHRAPEAVFFEFHDVVLYLTDLFWWLALAAWLVSRWPKLAPLRTGPRFLWLPLLGFVGLGALGAGLAVDGWYAVYQVLRLILLLGLYLLVVNAPLKPATVAWAVAGAMFVQAAIALPQLLLGHSLGLHWLGEVPLHPAWSGISVVISGDERWLRAYGLTQHPNLLGGITVALMLVALGYYVGRSRPRWGLMAGAILAGWAVLLATFSRAAWLALGVGGLVLVGLLVRHRRQWRHAPAAQVALLTGGLGVALAFALMFWPLLLPRLGVESQGVEIRSVQERSSLTEAAWGLIRQRPVLGVGLGGFPVAMYDLLGEEVGYPVYQPVHNVPLLVTAELGPLGGPFWLALMAAPWIALWRHRHDARITGWLAGLTAALTGLGVVSFVDAYVWSSHQGRLLLWIVLGLWAREWGQATGTALGTSEEA